MNLLNLKRKAAFLVALTIPLNLVGCGKENKDSRNSESGISSSEVGIVNNVPKNFKTYLELISEVTPVYSLEDIYLTEEEIEALALAASSEAECTNETVVLNADEIVNRIIENSNHGDFVTYDMSEEEKQELANLITKLLKKVITKMINDNALTKEDACNLQSLRIVVGSSNTSRASIIAYNKDENILYFDYNRILQYYDNIGQYRSNEGVFREGVKKYLEYAINCCRLKACPCRLEQGQTYEYALGTNNLETLEQMAIMSGNNDTLSAINELIFDGRRSNINRSASLVFLLAAFKENRTVEDFNKLMLDSDLPGIFDYFGLTTNEQIDEFYKILNTVNALTMPDYETKFYEENKAAEGLDFRNSVGYAYKESLFKYSIQDLMRYITSFKDLTKEEAMFLYKYVKSIVVNNTFIDYGATYQYDENYVKHVLAIENIYFEFLSKFYGISIDEVDALYEDYYSFSDLEYEHEWKNVDCKRLVEKFPLLQYIQVNYYTMNDNVNDFDESVGRK